MKLKILIATACVAMACSAAVYAETTSVTSTGGAGNVQDTADAQTNMLAVNVGDSINIQVTTNPSSDITLLSYKFDEAADSNNIQYVDQYVADPSTGECDITYKIRELPDKDGVYCLKINDGSSQGVATVYYKVGAPELEAGTDTTKTYYKKVTFGATGDKNDVHPNTTSVAYKATYKINGTSGANIKEYGFNVTLDQKTITSELKPVDNISGAGSFAFGITIYDIPESDVEMIDNIVATPIVNYNAATVAE